MAYDKKAERGWLEKFRQMQLDAKELNQSDEFRAAFYDFSEEN